MSKKQIEKLPQVPETYDDLFRNSEKYAKHYRESPYYPMFLAVMREVDQHNVKTVLEVGCGPGKFAQMLLKQATVDYQGFDFSPVAVRIAAENTARPELFYVADAAQSASDERNYDCIVCTEVLEHIENDLDVIRNWKEGTTCICSVPNTDSVYHVRYFNSEKDVRRRYAHLIDIRSITRVRVPQRAGMLLSQRLISIAKNFYRPGRLIRLMELAPFSWGGWFVFSGVRRDA